MATDTTPAEPAPPPPGRRRGLLASIERASNRVESPVQHLVGSHRLNPLPHAGTISVFLLIVVVVTGLYLTLFFQFGFDASYDSVRRMADHPIQSLIRTLHRYASAALVVTTLVHGWRVFVAGRFRGPRRWRWTSGVAALAVVWLAGVTGYWLVWDTRAEALNEILVGLFSGSGSFAAWLVRNLIGPDAGSGWSVLFLLWLAHLLLTCVIGFALWRHLRRSRLRILPPRHWMALMGAGLLIASVVLPAELLDAADGTRLVGELPLDPFILFLVPPLLGGWAWLAVVAASLAVVAVLVAPHLVRNRPPVAVVHADACTGCDLCVIDCPYLAVTLEPRDGHGGADTDVPVADDAATGSDAGATGDVVAGDDAVTSTGAVASAEAGHGSRRSERSLAVVDADACVGCGICVGSCSFGAIDLPGFESQPTVDCDGRRVVLACSRHVRGAGGPERLAAQRAPDATDPVTVEVACIGMVHPQVVGALTEAGATGVQVVGCPPGDCSYGIGNTILSERLDGTRAPHVPRRWQGTAAADFVAVGGLADAIGEPAAHPSADDTHLPPDRRRWVGAAAVVLVSIGAVALATQAPYGRDDIAAVRVVVDHVPGRPLLGADEPSGESGDAVSVIVRADGETVADERLPTNGAAAVGLVDVELDPGTVDLDVVLVQGERTTTLLSGPTTIDADRRVVVEAVDEPLPPGVADGRAVFNDQRLGGCDVCHSTSPGDDGVGPSLGGIADRAADRVPGLDAEAYLRQSILDPDAYVVDGFRAGQMLPIYRERLTDTQIDALVEYLMSLTEGAG